MSAPAHLPDLRGKVAIVTGSGTGIGFEIACCFAREGTRVVVNARAQERLSDIQEAISERGAECLAFAGDLREPEVAERLAAAAIERFGSIDIVVNNAGGTFNAPAEQISAKGWRAVIDTNLTTAFLVSRACFEHLRERQGAIVNISSIAAVEVPGPKHVHYSVAKAGMIQLTKSLAFEWGPVGIRVNCVCPGVVKTPRSVFAGNAEMEEAWRRRSPLQRLGDPSDIAETVLVLASEASAYTSGAVIRIDGGPRMWPPGG
jgi:NAD(P)-dependent dehydrogenase (short-subunit alcohol dehydrogenase family)